MGLTDEQVDSIIEMHSETVDGLKADVQKYRGEAEKLPSVQQELDDLKAKGDDGWKERHDAVKKELDDYRAEIAGKEARAAKETAVRALLESKGISGKNLTIAMRGLGAEIEAAELDGDKIKDTKAFDDLIEGDLSGLVTKIGEAGAPEPANPISNTGGKLSKADILAIKDSTERQNAIAANIEQFRKE
jgi:hypothetical protein